MKKYEFTGEVKHYRGHCLRRIRTLVWIGIRGIPPGTEGGWIEKESNLSHEGDCWVDDEAMVFDFADISGNAYVAHHVRVHGSAAISENAEVYDNTNVYGSAWIRGNVNIQGEYEIFGNAIIGGNASLKGEGRIFGYTQIS